MQKGLVQIPSGQILVCKIFLQKCLQDQRCPTFNPNQSPNEIWRQNPLDYRNYQGVQSVFRCKEVDQKQRVWFVLDNALVLPEYLVDFEYITDHGMIAENKRLQDVALINEECNQLFKGVTETQRVFESTSVTPMSEETSRNTTIHLTSQDLDRSDMGSLKRPLHQFMTTCHIGELMENHYEFPDDDKSGAAAIENSMPPEIPLRSQITAITDDLVVNLSRQNDHTQILYLNLFNNQIKHMKHLDKLSNLQTLILSFNQIEQIDGLNNCTQLKRLDLNHNFIKEALNVECLTALASLDLRHNWIMDASGLNILVSCCTGIKELGLKFNPLSYKTNYRINIFDLIPGL